MSFLQDYCSTDWQTLKKRYDDKLYPKADENRFRWIIVPGGFWLELCCCKWVLGSYRLQCFKSAWMTTVLHEGHKFPKTYQSLTTARLVHGDEVQWTLGALLYKTRYYPLGDIQMHHSSNSHPIWWSLSQLHSAPYLLMTCCAIVVAAILVYLRRLRIVRRSDLRKIPSMAYFMTDEGQMEEGILVRNMFLT